MEARDATGSTLMLAPLVIGLRALGHDPASVLGRQGLSERDLEDPQRRIPNAALLALWDAAPQVAGEDNFGLYAAQHYAPGMFNVLDYVVATAPTLGDALSRGTEFARLLHDLLQIDLQVEGERASLSLQPGSRVPLPRAQADFFMAAVLLLSRRLTGQQGPPLKLEFRHAAPADQGLPRRLFACPIDYGAQNDRIHFRADLLAFRSREADPKLAQVVTQHATLLAQQIPSEDPFIVRLRQLLAAHLDDPPALGETARKLGMSERTLRRRLEPLGTTFQTVLSELRISAAQRLMRDSSRSLDEIALEVGFSSGRALSRAFRRATGMAPSELREAARSTLSE